VRQCGLVLWTVVQDGGSYPERARSEVVTARLPGGDAVWTGTLHCGSRPLLPERARSGLLLRGFRAVTQCGLVLWTVVQDGGSYPERARSEVVTARLPGGDAVWTGTLPCGSRPLLPERARSEVVTARLPGGDAVWTGTLWLKAAAAVLTARSEVVTGLISGVHRASYPAAGA
jgi:hypothetical protein